MHRFAFFRYGPRYMFKAYERFDYTKFGMNAAVVYVLYLLVQHIFQQFHYMHCERIALQ